MHASSENPEPPAVEPDERTARLSAWGGRADRQATAVVTVEERPPDPATILYRLRTAFPHYAFLYDPHTATWTALRGPAAGGVTIVKRDPVALRVAVTETEGRRSQ